MSLKIITEIQWLCKSVFKRFAYRYGAIGIHCREKTPFRRCAQRSQTDSKQSIQPDTAYLIWTHFTIAILFFSLEDSLQLALIEVGSNHGLHGRVSYPWLWLCSSVDNTTAQFLRFLAQPAVTFLTDTARQKSNAGPQ